MPKCNKCNASQSRMNKGGLCKGCFQKKINPSIANTEDNDCNISKSGDKINYHDPTNDNNMIEFIKDSMIKEKKFNDDLQKILIDQVEFLKKEIIIKNTIIERLLSELYNRNPTNDSDDGSVSKKSLPSINDEDLLNESSDISLLNCINNNDCAQLEKTNDTENEPPSQNMNILHPNRYQVLINDGDSSFENEVTAANIKITQKPPSRKRNEIKIKSPRNMINRYTGKEVTQLKQTKSVPGNTSHSSTVNKEKKILLLSDSILSRVQMKLFNRELKTGRAYRKYFPGATPKEIAHYCIPTLEKDKPDVVVLNAGTNSLLNSDVNEISDEMFKLVRICRNNGVKEVYISGVTYRYNHATKVRNLNNFIESKEHIYNFTFINNDNIFGKDIGVDNLHLNYTGIVKIANNIIYAINTSGT